MWALTGTVGARSLLIGLWTCLRRQVSLEHYSSLLQKCDMQVWGLTMGKTALMNKHDSSCGWRMSFLLWRCLFKFSAGTTYFVVLLIHSKLRLGNSRFLGRISWNPTLQQHATYHCPEAGESRSHTSILFKIDFNIILPSSPSFASGVCNSVYPINTLHAFLFSSMSASCPAYQSSPIWSL